ncbi:MAG: hypothetical protein WC982_11710 [Advenella sp.]
MRNSIKIILLILLQIELYSHTLVMDMMDNGDNTITVVGMFNTGESAAGAMIIVEALDSGEILFQQRLSNDNEIIIQIPTLPYKVILDGGPGHTVEKAGIAPNNGFKEVEKIVHTKTETKKQQSPSRSLMQISSSVAVTVSIILAFILLFATVVISIINTNKLMSNLNN